GASKCEVIFERALSIGKNSTDTVLKPGSVARGEASAKSDVDLMVEFDPAHHRIGLFAFIRLRHRLEDMLGTYVDLVTPKALKRQLRDQILREAICAG
ncbi:MAG: nucleotidyltransferase family protein, partial [Desulfobacteraceae bacterium]|nr:nucleotidyltransferase family protein [Desulfobacteraceae bacterium]